MADFPNQELAPNPKGWLGTFTNSGASKREDREGVEVMLGKLAGAWLGEKIVGRDKGAKGAILGYGVAALARRSVPTLAAAAAIGWGYRKWRKRHHPAPSYPSEASPA